MTSLQIKSSKLPQAVTFVIQDGQTMTYELQNAAGQWIIQGEQTANVDDWLVLRTRQQYNLNVLLDMAKAFEDGLASAYQQSDVLQAASMAFRLTKMLLFDRCWAGRYAAIYGVEVQTPRAIEDMVDRVRNHFDKIRESLGDPAFASVLGRYARAAEAHNLDCKDVWQKMKQRLDHPGAESKIDSEQLDADVQQRIKQAIEVAYPTKYPKDKHER